MKDVVDKAVPLLVTTGGFLGFVAFVGGAVTWSRFYAATLPAEQAVDAVPNSELIVTGALSLTVFAVFGGLAVLIAYLISPQGRPTRAMLYALLVLAAVEAVVVLVVAHETQGRHEAETVVSLLLLLVAVALTAVAIERWAEEHVVDGQTELKLRPRLMLGLAGLAITLAIATALVVQEWWVLFALPLPGLLALAAYRIAAINNRFEWYGVALFFSVALFGAAVAILNALYEPKLQPAAIVRAGDPPGQGLQGLYIAETEDRVYLGSVATEKCNTRDLRADAGRIFWVPKSQVVAMAIGPRQTAITAAVRAPEMLEDLIASRLPADEPATDSKGDESSASQEPAETDGLRLDAPPDSPGVTKDSTGGARDAPASSGSRPLTSHPTAHAVNVGPAIREEPNIQLRATSAQPGERLEIVGEGIGPPGSVTVGGVDAQVEFWGERTDTVGEGRKRKRVTREVIEFRVPDNARSGRVVVSCAARGNRPALRVLQPPVAAAVATPVKGRRRVFRLDATASTDPDGRIETYRWEEVERTVGTRPVIRLRAAADGPTHVRLVVTDDDALEDITTVRVARGETKIVLPGDVLFCFDCRTLSRRGLRVIATLRRRLSRASAVRITGHTDATGPRAYNQRLGRDRANAVADALLAGLNVASEPQISSRGELRPRADNRTAGGRARNRRVELVITGVRR